MFPPSFDYRRAEDVEEAVEMLAGDPDAVPLSGGHSLIPEMKDGRVSPGTVVDVGDVPALRGIERSGDRVRVGAATTYAELLDSDLLRSAVPVLPGAAEQLGDVQIRNRGTIGGNLARAHPAADLPAAAVAAEATVHLRGPDGTRTVPASSFVLGAGESAVGDGELVTAVSAPRALDAGDAYRKKTHPATGYAMVGVAARVRVEGGTVTDARVAANGATGGAPRLTAVEEALVGESPTEEVIEAAADRATAGVDPDEFRSDVEASGEFRAHLLEVYARRALDDAVDAATAPADG